MHVFALKNYIQIVDKATSVIYKVFTVMKRKIKIQFNTLWSKDSHFVIEQKRVL